VSATVDVNILLYASDESSAFHQRAFRLIEGLTAGPDLVYLFWPVLMAYLRIATHPAIFPRPLAPTVAAANVEALLAPRHVRTPGEAEAFWQTYRSVTSSMVASGNLVPDAHLVALMRENGVATLWTHDRDFRRFDAIRVRDPFA